jgi:hypothetical protein
LAFLHPVSTIKGRNPRGHYGSARGRECCKPLGEGAQLDAPMTDQARVLKQ